MVFVGCELARTQPAPASGQPTVTESFETTRRVTPSLQEKTVNLPNMICTFLLSALRSAFVSFRRLLTTTAAMGTLVFAVGVSTLRAADAGSITGSVSNTATGNLLEGAKIEIPRLRIPPVAAEA